MPNVKLGNDTVSGVDAIELENADSVGNYVKFLYGDVSYNHNTLYLNITFTKRNQPEGEVSFDILVSTSASGSTPAQTVYSKTYTDADDSETLHLAIDLTNYITTPMTAFKIGVQTNTCSGDVANAGWYGMILPQTTNSAHCVTTWQDFPSIRAAQPLIANTTDWMGSGIYLSSEDKTTTGIVDIYIELDND